MGAMDPLLSPMSKTAFVIASNQAECPTTTISLSGGERKNPTQEIIATVGHVLRRFAWGCPVVYGGFVDVIFPHCVVFTRQMGEVHPGK